MVYFYRPALGGLSNNLRDDLLCLFVVFCKGNRKNVPVGESAKGWTFLMEVRDVS